MTLKEWIEEKRYSLIEFEKLSGVPYQRISEHMRLGRPFSEEYVLKILKATNGEVAVETLRPKLGEILGYIA